MADILILGVNGYSGRVTARYLLEHPQRNTFKLALAARSHEKVKATGLALDDSVRIWAVDVTDEQSVEAAVRQVAVVINCVGPYWTSGTNVVKACAKHGKHYVDLTGETPYIFEIIRLYDLLAVQNHSIIIPACGFDSAPSDIVVYLANKTLKSRHSNAEIEDSVTAVDGSGRVAGGTLRTVLAMIEEVPSSIQRFCLRPYALSPIHGGPAHPPFRLLHNLPAPMSYIRGGIHPMSLVNRAVVERTFGLQQYLLTTSSLTSARDPKLAYGPRFRYNEFWIKRNIFSSLLLSISIAVAGLSLMFLPPVRWLLKLFSSKSGNGPSESSEKKGFLEMINVTTATTSTEQKPLRVRTTIHGKASPLYLSSVMVAEAALALLAPNELPALAREGGVLTPMSGLGDTLVTRLQRTNMFSFSSECVDEKEESAKRK